MINLRNDNSSTLNGFIWANGGYATKHSFGVYSTEPAKKGFRYGSPQVDIDSLDKRELASTSDAASDLAGQATIEAYTVMHDRQGAPETAIAAVLLKDSRRAWATSTDIQVATALCTDEWVGRKVNLNPDGTLNI